MLDTNRRRAPLQRQLNRATQTGAPREEKTYLKVLKRAKAGKKEKRKKKKKHIE